MSREIAVQQSSVEMARLMADSTMLPKAYQKQPANLLFAFEYADALGIPRINALTSIHVIDGKPTASADLIAALVRRAGHKMRIEGDETYAEATIIRADDPEYVPNPIRWDEQRARKAGLWTRKGPWQQYPGAMMRARAITEAARMWASDALYGVVYTAEELGAQVDMDGNPVQVQSQRVQPQPQESAPSQPASGMDQLAAAVEHPTVDVDSFLARVEQTTDTDELRALWTEAAQLPANEVKGARDLIEARVELAQMQAQPDPQPQPESEQPTLDGEIVEDGAA